MAEVKRFVGIDVSKAQLALPSVPMRGPSRLPTMSMESESS